MSDISLPALRTVAAGYLNQATDQDVLELIAQARPDLADALAAATCYSVAELDGFHAYLAEVGGTPPLTSILGRTAVGVITDELKEATK